MPVDNGNITICYPNRVSEGTLSGGSWTSNLPLANLKDRVIKKRARSTNLLAASTKFNATWTRARPISVIALAGHNFSVEATVSIKIYDDSMMTTLLYDSGVINVWPSIYQSTDLEWEYDNFWLGTVDDDDRQNFTPLFTHFINVETTPIAKYMTVEIFDTTNTDGYVEIGRLFFGDAWQPTLNASLGIQFGYSTSTGIESALDDTEYFDRRTPKRSVNLTLDHMIVNEAFGRVFDIQRQQGVDGEVLFAYTKQDVLNSYERRFLGRLSQLDAISEPYVDTRHTAALSIIEII